ncbi:MAG: DUF4282 domain-containing protein [Arcobacteraceae bacterium]|nr:DUF4282 domain-containing protein [Arcobacteraceae bacterium]
MESITNFFNFNTLITPYIIGFIYIAGAIVVPFIVIYYFKKYRLHINSGRYRLYLFISFVILEIFWRIFCEFFMVYFKIFLALQ